MCRLTTNFAYVPLTRAQPPSALRQLAYREGSSLVGPQGDPQGWKVLPAVKVVGTVFDARKVEFECTVRIAYIISDRLWMTTAPACRCHAGEYH